ncbi:collagen-binding domain-containing protein [Streptomyces sp. KL116D]|uniref:collagen-binding domain-containing protein n=1 Tax=Streptomyces sp. KL116D TaxID=3045152 RepID=UPI0035592ABD
MTKRTKVMVLAGGAVCTATLAALAGSPAGAIAPAAAPVSIGNPVAGSNGFGVVTEGDATLGSTESEGPVAIGGDLTFGPGYNIALNDAGSYVAPGDSNPTALIVGGRVDYAGSTQDGVLQVLQNGYVKIGDMTGGQTLNTDDNGAAANTHIDPAGAAYDATPRIELTTTQPADSVASKPMDFASLFTTYRERAATMAECLTTVRLRDGAGNPVEPDGITPGSQVRIALDSGQTNVLHLTGEQLNNIGTLIFDDQPTADTPLLIVVDTTGTASDFTWHTPTVAGISGAQAPYILWDFPDATDITIADGDTTEGTIFAPNARLTDLDPSNIEGDVIVKELIAGPLDPVSRQAYNAGEIHYFPFAADLECDCESPSPTPSPSRSSATPTPTPTPSPSESTPTPTPTPSTPTPTTPGPTTPVPTTPGPTAPQPTPTGPGLAHTGADRVLWLLSGIAGVLVGTGTALTLRTRRTRGRHEG